MHQPWPVAVFAHNEETRITSCLESIARGSASRPVHAYVLVNGSTDRTEAVVRKFANFHSGVSAIVMRFGDKANAWNVFVHEIAPPADFCFFVDGDVLVEPTAFDALTETLQHSPEASAAAAVPSSGRNRQFLTDMVCRHRLVLGNLYALRGSFLRRTKEIRARIPTGYIGEDALVTSLVKWDLDPTGQWVEERVAPSPQARFFFDSLSLWNPRDWRIYWRRRVRYSIRHYQHEFLMPLLTRDGLTAMPDSVSTLYSRQADLLARCRPRGGADAVFDRRALLHMRSQLQEEF